MEARTEDTNAIEGMAVLISGAVDAVCGLGLLLLRQQHIRTAI